MHVCTRPSCVLSSRRCLDHPGPPSSTQIHLSSSPHSQMALAGNFRSLLFWSSVLFVLAVSISLRKHIFFRAPSTRISIQDVLHDLDIPPLYFPATFHIDVPQNSAPNTLELKRIVVRRPAPNSPDTTAVILNWSRLPNVIRIVSLLCGPWLDDTIATVFIWNNSPQKLSQRVCLSALIHLLPKLFQTFFSRTF